MAHLRLEAQGPTLPPDHLGIACEVLACAVAQGEEMLTRELFRRYLRSWCVAASRRLEGRSDLLAVLPRRFQTYLAALPGVSNEDP